MSNTVQGLHHITAIAGNAQRNYDFYTGVLGLRMVKRTVNFDDPNTYHLYFGDEHGTPGTILTFFPWEGVRQGRNGAGMATEIGFSVPEGSMEFWEDRFSAFDVPTGEISERFGEQYLPFEDPDGLKLTLIVSVEKDDRKPWETDEVRANVAIRGFHSVTLTLNQVKPTAGILTGVLGYQPIGQEGRYHRYRTDSVQQAAIVDILEDPAAHAGLNAGGTNHHVAFRVRNEDVLMAVRDKVEHQGLHITPKIDRDYFFSVYFREPGGVLFELATDNPGFAADESPAELGRALKLPRRYEPVRSRIEETLPPLLTS